MLFVFMSQPDFSCNPYALWKYICENTEHETAWVVKRPERYEALRERRIECAVYNTIEGRNLIDKADYVIMNSYTFLEVEKRENQIFVNLWHGSGIKAHDYYNHDMSPGQARKLQTYFEKIDMMCVHSLDDRFRLSAQLHFDMRRAFVTGQPRLDCVMSSNGSENLKKLYGNALDGFDRLILYVPSFRANMSSHSGQIFSENVFRLNDYHDAQLNEFLEKNHAALVYKLHPIEQTAFKGRRFSVNERCFELTDNMLFDADVRYTEILNAFDVMISDYSSIVFDYLLLDRPVIYLIPDYEEYRSQRGFVFRNIDSYMPGDKAFDFRQMLDALQRVFDGADGYQEARGFVLSQRFDYRDNQSSKRCLEAILNYQKEEEEMDEFHEDERTRMPSAAEHLMSFLPEGSCVVDSTKRYSDDEKNVFLHSEKKIFYISSEIPNPYRRLTGQSSAEIADIDFYEKIKHLENCKVVFVQGGVDYALFAAAAGKSSSCLPANGSGAKKRIGFAGTIDNRIYFSMVQCICETFPDYDVVFAGHIYRSYPIWLDGFANLHYIEASYQELPQIIQSFEVAILPFFGRHQQTVPTELFQYMAVGKQVVASDMPNLPRLEGIYRSDSVADVIDNIRTALRRAHNQYIITGLQDKAAEHDWKAKVLSKEIF